MVCNKVETKVSHYNLVHSHFKHFNLLSLKHAVQNPKQYTIQLLYGASSMLTILTNNIAQLVCLPRSQTSENITRL